WIVTNPRLDGASVTTDDQGSLNPYSWGATWTFSVTVTNPDVGGYTFDDMNVSLWLNMTGDWELANSTIADADDSDYATGKSVSFIHYFDCGDIGSKDYKFNITSFWNYNNTTSDIGFNILKDDVTIISNSDPANIDRESGFGLFVFRIRDDDNSSSFVTNSSTNAAIYFSYKNVNEHNISYSVNPNSTGYLNYSLDPDCNYSNGIHYWKAGTTTDDCYYAVNFSSNPTFNITGQLKNFIIQPSESSQFAVGTLVNITSNISSDCQENLSSATVTHEARLSPSGTWEWANITAIENQEFGKYNATWNTSFHQGGNWSFKINASKLNYYSNSTIFTNWTYLNNTAPTAENASVSPEANGWGSNYSFKISVDDMQYDNVTCKLFTYTAGSWTYRGNDTVEWGVGNCTVNVSDFSCSDINTSSLNWFKWEIDDATNVFNTSNVSAPSITKDNVTIYYEYGNNSTANRNMSQTDLLIVRIFDNNSQKYVGSDIPNATGRIFVTTNGNDFDSGTQNITNSSGYLNIYFDATGDFSVGIQNWTGGTYGDGCYYDTNLTQNYTLIVKGDLANSISQYISPGGKGESVIKPNNVTLQLLIEDDEEQGISGASLNITFINVLYGNNFTCDTVMEISSGYYNCTMNTTLMSAGWYNITIDSNKTYYNDGHFFDYDVFYIETAPEVTLPTILSHNGSDIGGWGETWTALTNVTDEDQDNVTLKVQVKKYTDPDVPASWVDENQSSYFDNPDLRGPVNQSMNLTFQDLNFQNEQVVWQVRFMVNDTDGYGSVSGYTNFTIDKDDILIELIFGDDEQVWRNGTEILYLILNVTDIDQNLPADGANITFFITTNSSDSDSFDSGTTYPANTSGISEYPFQPDCLYSTGEQIWYAKNEPDPFYKYNFTPNYSLIIKTYIALEVTHPNGESYLVGTQIPFIGRVFDECFNISGAEVIFYDRRPGASERFYTCSGTTDWGNGTYNCTWDSSAKPPGWHGVKIEARKEYYGDYPNYNETIRYTPEVETHHLSTQPSISLGWSSYPPVDPKVDGWGKLRTFQAKITDLDATLNNISLWKSFDNVTWYLINSTNMTPQGIDVQVRYNLSGTLTDPFMNRFTCGDLSNATGGIVYFKFNTTDVFGYTDETQIDNFTVQVDNVTVTIDSSSNSTVRRIGENKAFLRFTIRDDDYGNYYPSNVNGSVWITLNGTNYSHNITNSSYSGNLTVYYNATCDSDVGIQYWKGGTIDSCYETANTTNETLTVYGQLNVSVISPLNESVANLDKNVSLNSSIKDECGQIISGATVSWYNSSLYSLGNDYNVTWHVPINYKLGNETIITNATRTYYDYNNNNTTVYVYGWSDVSYIEPLNETFFDSGDDIEIECRVTDSNNTQPIANYTVFIYVNDNYLENLTTDSNGWANTSWDTSGESAGWYNITCSIEDNSTLYYNSSFSQNETWIMLERPLKIDIIRMDGSICQQGLVCDWIYRNDTFSPYKVNITVHVKDANIGSANNSTVRFYNSTNLLGNCTTNSTGWCYLENYNPYDDMNPAVITIYINATRPENEDSVTNTSLLRVKGILNVTVISPPDTVRCGASGFDCKKSEAINLTVVVFSENGENASTLNPTVTWYNETSQVITGSVSILLPQSEVKKQDTGNHNFMAVATKNSYDSGSANVTFNITGTVTVTWTSPTVETPYPYDFYPTCYVEDEDEEVGVDEYLVNFSYRWEPSPDFIFNGTYLTNSSGYANYTFTPTQKGNISFNCTIGDNTSRYYSKSPTNYVDVEYNIWVKDLYPPQFYNVSIVPNESIEANLNYTNITVFVNDNYQIKTVKVYIEYPNTTTENKTMTNLTPIQSGFGYYNATYNLTFIPPIGGIFNITIYAIDQDPENNYNSTSKYNISVWGVINGSVIQCVNNTNDGNLTDCDSEITAPFISQTNSFTFEVKSNFTNLGPAGAYGVNLTHSEDPLGSLNYSDSYHECGILYPNDTCSWDFNVTVPAATTPGLYLTRVNSTWQNPDNTYQSIYNVTYISVDSNPMINITETELISDISHNRTTNIGNVTIVSAGNDEVRNINLSWYGISGVSGSYNLALNCPLCIVSITPNQETILFAGNNFTSNINITVPAGQNPGNYLADVIAISENAGNDTALLNLTVPLNDSWIRTPTSGTFGTILAPLNTNALIGYVNVTNIGNIKMAFEVVKVGDLYSYTKIENQNWFSFDLEKLGTRTMNVTYSIPAAATTGVYDITIYIRNSSLSVTQRTVTLSLNVTDIPPNITDVQIVPISFERNYENVTIQANVTDNFAVDMVWANITPPNESSFILWMQNYTGFIYNVTYLYPVAGTHEIIICANDTSSLLACTSPTNITSSDTTQLIITPNATLLNATNITIDSGQSFAINFSVDNIGGSRANNTNLSITYPNNITVSYDYFYLGEVLKNTSVYNQTTITVVNSTAPGIYIVNLTVNWTNLNNTFNSSIFNITINVTANAEIDIVESVINKIIDAGDSDNSTLTLRSIGNDNVTNVNISCSSGEICNNFIVDIDPWNISLMPIGNISYINITFTVPPNYPTGDHNGYIRVDWNDSTSTQNFSKEIPVYILVPANISWIHDLTKIEKRVYDNETGSFGQINITNTGNANATLNLTINGTIANLLTLNEYNITLFYGETQTIYIDYSSPNNITYNTNYTGYITSNITGSLRENASVKEVSTFVSLFVTPYSVSITYPTQINPILDVNPSDTIQSKINITENGTIVSSAAMFEVILFNDTISISANITNYSFNASENLWFVNFTAPNISIGRIYNLNITANHTGVYNSTKYDIEYGSIVYNDTTAPIIDVILPIRTPANQTVNIKINVTEYGGLKNITSNITRPDNSSETLNLTSLSNISNVYSYEANFSNTSEIGNYNLNVIVCDLSGNCNSESSSFEIYPTAYFSGYAIDAESVDDTPIYINFTFHDSNTTNKRFNFGTNLTNGYYNETIDVKLYDLRVKTVNQSFKHTIEFDSINISTNYYNPIILGNIPNVRTTTTAFKGLYIYSVLSSSNMKIVMDFSECLSLGCGLPIFDPQRLAIYKYNGNWTPKVTSSQNTLWDRINNEDGDNSDNSVNLTSLSVSATVSSLNGAYILAEFICGDDECERSFGESSDNCPIDCPSLPPTPPTEPTEPTPGGGGGGAGAGTGAGVGVGGAGGAAAAVTPVIPTPVPLEIKSTLLETTLAPGEEKIFSVDVTNNLETSTTATLIVEGPVFALLTVQKPSMSISAKSTEVSQIRALAPLSAVPGIYTGDLVIKSGSIVHRIPVTITVRDVLVPLLDVQIKALSKEINPGANLSFEISLVNMGETAEVEDITVTYSVKPVANQTQIISTSSETLAVEDKITYRRVIEIPQDTPEEKYIIEANASYWYGAKFALSADNFDVTTLPWPLLLLRAAFMNWITYVILLGGVPALIIGIRWYSAYRASKTAKARYIAPLDFKKLPQRGPDSLLVGKIAETDVKAYMSIPQLLMHSIAAGGTGSGKTVSAMVCSEELMKRKVPIIVFDPTAQWTGFMKPCKLKPMLQLYSRFGLKPTDATRFKVTIILVEDSDMPINIKEYMKPGEMTVFVMNRLKGADLDKFVRRSIQAIFDMRPSESKEIKLLVVYDEVHRLLPKYGGKKGYVAIERACREFRKWGIGIFLISQVLLDFKGAIRANIANEIQLRTKYEGDIGRVKSKYGSDYASKVTRLTIGTGLFQNPEYNHGRPWFLSFRPLLHSPFALTDKEIDTYMTLDKKVKEIEDKIKKLKAKKVDTYDIEVELNIARDKVKTAAFRMAKTYLESIEKRLEKMGVK
ncbi:MAG: DUF87 domain-containing protein, partial [Candidatus Aenigmarchaeota archaeon]|nr:DUF87 domain-containing protein [Candidatus Aenigmarchaeota archaeon]